MFEANANRSVNTFRFTCQHNLRCHKKYLISSRSKSKMGNAGHADSSNSLAPSGRKKSAKSLNRAESDSPANCKKQFFVVIRRNVPMWSLLRKLDLHFLYGNIPWALRLPIPETGRSMVLPWMQWEGSYNDRYRKAYRTTCHYYIKEHLVRVENLETCMETKADKAVLDDTDARFTSCGGQLLGLAKDIPTLNKKTI